MTTAPTRPKEMPKAYDPKQVEGKWYSFWTEKGYFTPKIDWSKKPFVIIMPPSNVTGELHMGHALTMTIEDIMTRWHRMLGEPTLWLPGTDHAGIAAQVVVEQTLAAEGLTRHDLGREKFLERMWQWMDKYGHVIDDQVKKLGASCDWTRDTFTMDSGPARAVRVTFVNLFNKGLIYRGERIINWCPRCTTSLSDLEVEHEDVSSHLWYMHYPLAGEDGTPEPGRYVTVATTRPETMLGDTAVAVNPDDARFKDLIGRHVILPLVNRLIPIIADELVDPGFGTGAVKVTPAHDPNDFDIGQRHALETINILNLDATINENGGRYAGLDRFVAREAVVSDLRAQGLLEKIEPHLHAVGHCIRCKTTVEPIVSKQWFVKIAPLAIPAIHAVIDGDIKFIPDRFTKVYLNWMENIRDWCISRQLWWGHRIPVWYCDSCGEMVVALENPTACPKCGASELTQDPDVLDTWFSSGLWPHSTLGWPDDTEDLRYFYPSSVMETAYDIIFFWVARMIMMGLENTGKIPFHTVYLHGLIRDDKGDKMSKSRGNVVDPLVLMAKYGTDALRFGLTTGSTPGNDIKISETRLESARNFANKIWNAARFVVSNMEPAEARPALPEQSALPLEDRWVLSRLSKLTSSVTKLMEDYQFGEAGRQVYEFLWSEYCDWYIELSKVRLRKDGATSPLPVLHHALEVSLRLLHPFMPFITEEIWQSLNGYPAAGDKEPAFIVIAPYPGADAQAVDERAEEEMGLVMELIRNIRNARAEFGVEPAKWVEAVVAAGEAQGLLESQAETISTLARVKPLRIEKSITEKPKQALTVVAGSVEAYLPLAEVVNLEAERRRLQKDIASAEQEAARLSTKLDNAEFTTKAPPAVVERERARLAEQQERLTRLQDRLRAIS